MSEDSAKLMIALKTDPQVYWLQPYYFVEFRLARELLVKEQSTILALRIRQQHELCLKKLKDQTPPEWKHTVTIFYEIPGKVDFSITYRYCLYEQPSFSEEFFVGGGPQTYRIRVSEDKPNMFVRPCYVDLDLRRLYYYGEDTKGALRNGTLYVLRHGPMLDPIYYCDIRRAWVSRKDPNFYIPWSAETFEEREQTFASSEHFWNWYTAKKVPT